jgi:superfamily I DNA/RNA helicase
MSQRGVVATQSRRRRSPGGALRRVKRRQASKPNGHKSSTGNGQRLPPQQQQAITAVEGPVAIVAGAGCGKTTALAFLTFALNQRRFDPSTVLVVTFTTEAARRLRREAARELGDRATDVAILTLHALGRRVIDTWAIQLGYEDRPSVLHQDEARALLASAASKLGCHLAAVPGVGGMSV